MSHFYPSFYIENIWPFSDCGSEVHKKPPFKMTDILCILFIINEQESRYSEPHLKGRMGKRTGVHLIPCFLSSNMLPCLVYWIRAVSCMLTTTCIKSICLFWPLKTTRSKALLSLQRPITVYLLMEFLVNGMQSDQNSFWKKWVLWAVR